MHTWDTQRYLAYAGEHEGRCVELVAHVRTSRR